MSLVSYFLYLDTAIEDPEQANVALEGCGQQIALIVQCFFTGMRNAGEREYYELFNRARPFMPQRDVSQQCLGHINRLCDEGVCTEDLLRTLVSSSAYPVLDKPIPMMSDRIPWQSLPLHMALNQAVINCVTNPDPGFMALTSSPEEGDIHLSLSLVVGDNLLPAIVYSKVLKRLVYIRIQVHDAYEQDAPLFYDDRRAIELIEEPTIVGITPTH